MLLGDRDPPDSCKCKKVSGTKTVEQKWRNKNWWGQCKCRKVSRTKIGGHCQPLGDGDPKCKCKKVSGTKIAEQKLVSASAKIGQWKCKKVQWNKNCRTKIGGDSWPLGDGDPKCKCKKVSGTKIAERKL